MLDRKSQSSLVIPRISVRLKENESYAYLDSILRHSHYRFFDLEGRNNLSALVDNLFRPPRDIKVPIFNEKSVNCSRYIKAVIPIVIHVSHVPRVEPTFAAKSGGI